ncbi:MAG TPA: TolC family protein [Thermoanaerobaculia bacterium]|nr:TolC family protein [Thermoanaerobaculia bacterium]
MTPPWLPSRRRWLAAVSLVGSLGTLLVTGQARGQTPPHSISLEEALTRALETNPVLGQAAAGVARAEAEKRLAFSAVMPRLSLEGRTSLNSEEVAFGEGENRRTILTDTDWTARLVLSQPVFAGFRDVYTYRQTKLDVAGAGETARGTREALLFEVAASYWSALEAEELAAVERQNRELALKRLELAKSFVAAGEATRLDELRAESAVKAAERRIVEAEQGRIEAISRLRVATGLEGDLDVVEPRSALPPLPAEAELLRSALDGSPEVRRAQLALESAGYEVKKARGTYLPIVRLEAAAIEQKSQFPSDSYQQVSLEASIPLFESGETRARLAIARERERQARLMLEDAQRRVREQLAIRRAGLGTAVQARELARQQLAVAEAEHEQVLALYQAQEATSLDLDAAELGLAAARRDVVSAGIRVTLAELALRWAASQLAPSLLPGASPQP